MASHYKFYPSSDEVVVPWNARYQFPSQANKCVKMTPRIPPKNGGIFTPGGVIRLEFPAQGYVNPANTTVCFDVALSVPSTAASTATTLSYRCCFQNNIQSIFSRVRLLYGSTPIEDITNYNVIVRCLTEWTTGNPTGTIDQSSINEGIGGAAIGNDTSGFGGLVNVRQAYIQGCSFAFPDPASGASGDADDISRGGPFSDGRGNGFVPHTNTPGISGVTAPTDSELVTRRYQVQLMLGLLQQQKLIPTKYMASQLAIELTLEQATACIMAAGGDTFLTFAPTYWVGNVNLIPEILEFDPSYDASFLMGLSSGGVPIKFASWHTHLFSSGNSTSASLQVNERSRSVKSIFTVQRRPQTAYGQDSGATLFDSSAGTSTVGTESCLQQYQYRIGGR
jgi:hypothetical protein